MDTFTLESAISGVIYDKTDLTWVETDAIAALILQEREMQDVIDDAYHYRDLRR